MKRKTFRKLAKCLWAMLLILGIQSCETEIPPEDPTPPEFSFQIHGDGFYHVFDQNTDFDNLQLKLKNGANYTFTLSGGDQGGVERIQWFISSRNYTPITTPIAIPWTQRNLGPLQKLVEWVGDPSNPLTGNTIQGNFRANARVAAASFRFYVSDFGGQGNRPNSISKELYLYLDDQPTELSYL